MSKISLHLFPYRVVLIVVVRANRTEGPHNQAKSKSCMHVPTCTCRVCICWLMEYRSIHIHPPHNSSCCQLLLLRVFISSCFCFLSSHLLSSPFFPPVSAHDSYNSRNSDPGSVTLQALPPPPYCYGFGSP